MVNESFVSFLLSYFPPINFCFKTTFNNMVNDTSRQQQSNASLHTLWHTIKCSNHWKYKFRWGKNLHSLEKGSGFSKTLFFTLHTLVVFVCDYYGLKMVENWKPWINWIYNARDSRRIWHICEESFYVICHLFDSMIKRTWILTFIDKMHAILFSFFFFNDFGFGLFQIHVA